MIEKLKYSLSWLKKFFYTAVIITSAMFAYFVNWSKEHKRIYISCLSIIMAVSICLTAWLTFTVYTVSVFDGRNTYTVRTFNNNVSTVFEKLALKPNDYNVKSTNGNGKNTYIEIEYTFPVYVTVGDKTSTVYCVSGNTVADALVMTGIIPDQYDYTQPALDTALIESTYIDFTDVDFVFSTYNETIHYKTETIYSDSLDKGKTQIIQKGSEGIREVTLSEKFVNGEFVEKAVLNTKVVKEAVNAKKLVGTKTTPKKPVVSGYSSAVKSISTLSPTTDIALDANGNPVNYKSKMTCRATAYTYTGHNCATGVKPQPGYIAVNPKVIPYGTKLYIKSADGSIIYGYAVAADTGGFVKKYPTGIDLFMPTQSACSSFGVRNMEVYILN